MEGSEDMEAYEVITRLLFAIVVGGVIGYERAFKNRPAGFRTHILVCVGATVISMIQIETVEQTKALIIANPVLSQALKADIGRMGAQVITGVGFLGAGTIIREKGLVKGLTTAASVWVVSCIGLAIGLGMYFISAMSTIGVFIALVILKKVEDRFIDQAYTVEFEIKYDVDRDFVKQMQSYFDDNHIKVKNIRFIPERQKEDKKTKEMVYDKTLYTVEVPRHKQYTEIIQELYQYKNVIAAKVI